MDFVVILPMTIKDYDSIWIIVSIQVSEWHYLKCYMVEYVEHPSVSKSMEKLSR